MKSGREAGVIGGYVYEAVPAVLAVIVFSAMVSIVYASWRNGISPMPSSARVRTAVAEEVNRLASYGTIVDAGAGWGTLAFELARRCPGSRIIGIENSPVPLWTARCLGRLAFRYRQGAGIAKEPRIRFIRGDLYDYSYEGADVVVCYLYPGAMKRLGPILRKRLPSGARVVSICFAMPGWVPERVVVCGDTLHTKVYVYAPESGE
jgi:hypothetical protein